MGLADETNGPRGLACARISRPSWTVPGCTVEIIGPSAAEGRIRIRTFQAWYERVGNGFLVEGKTCPGAAPATDGRCAGAIGDRTIGYDDLSGIPPWSEPIALVHSWADWLKVALMLSSACPRAGRMCADASPPGPGPSPV